MHRPSAVRYPIGLLVLLLALALATATPSAGGQQGAAVPELLAKAAAYLDSYERQLSAVIADENYHQELGRGQIRDLRADIMLLDLGGSSWAQFRDVFEMNRRSVRDHDARLQALFDHPSSDLLSQAQRIADESAHYNVGVQRNINVPTMALTYLSRANQARSAFATDGQDTIDKTRVTILKFTETSKVPLIKTAAGQIETSGRFWIAPDTGAVWRSELSVSLPEGITVSRAQTVKGTITVYYAQNPELKFLVPSRMEEDYSAPSRLRGRATYSHYQAFSVNVAALVRGGG